jgi:PadR family transcriptional regulator, regulatory protein PadR
MMTVKSQEGLVEKEHLISPIEEAILSVLLGLELYGLQICKAFEESSQGKRNMSVGTLYPVMARLERAGLVTSRMEDNPNGRARRKYFRITINGSRALDDVQEFRKRLAKWTPVNG